VLQHPPSPGQKRPVGVSVFGPQTEEHATEAEGRNMVSRIMRKTSLTEAVDHGVGDVLMPAANLDRPAGCADRWDGRLELGFCPIAVACSA
jgi:hypothetical protein